MSKHKRPRCPNGTQRHDKIGPDCYSKEQINEWKSSKKTKKNKNGILSKAIEPATNNQTTHIQELNNKEPINYDCLQLETLKKYIR